MLGRLFYKIKTKILEIQYNLKNLTMFARWIANIGKLEGIAITWNKNIPQRRRFQFSAIYYSEEDQFYSFSLWWITLVFSPEYYVWNELFDNKQALMEIIKENPALHALSPNKLVRERAEHYLKIQEIKSKL